MPCCNRPIELAGCVNPVKRRAMDPSHRKAVWCWSWNDGPRMGAFASAGLPCVLLGHCSPRISRGCSAAGAQTKTVRAGFTRAKEITPAGRFFTRALRKKTCHWKHFGMTSWLVAAKNSRLDHRGGSGELEINANYWLVFFSLCGQFSHARKAIVTTNNSCLPRD